MYRHLALLSIPLVVLLTATPIAGAGRVPTQTRMEAEVNILRVLPRTLKAWRVKGLVDARTGLLADNTEAVCHGTGTRHAGNRYARFTCVIRPHLHRRRQGLYVSYRALARGRFMLRFVAYRRR